MLSKFHDSAAAPARPAALDGGAALPPAEEAGRHAAAIADLAALLHRSVREVEPLYLDVLAQMRAQAAIADFLPIFVARRVRRLLEH